MNDERWKSFAAFAARLLGKPTFDSEEREPRMRVATDLAGALARVSAEDGSTSEVERVLASSSRRLGDFLPGRSTRWFLEWLRAEDTPLRAALVSFASPRERELDRFDAFALAYRDAVSAERIAPDDAAALAVGSLLNFAVEPTRLPIVLEKPARTLAGLLGADAVAGAAEGDRYRGHLEFARAVEGGLAGAGVPVRDMLDVQSLMLLAVRTPEFWAGAIEPAQPASARTHDVYLSACAIYRDEAPYLREWIEFHRLVGVERFYLYDNRSADDHREVLAPYVESGIVRLHDWPMEGRAQLPAYEHCVREHGAESRWIAFLDLDEFLFSPTGQSLTELLPEYERWPGVGVNWAVFGPSGHERKPPGTVIESYNRRLSAAAHTIATRTIKSIVDPARVAKVTGVHAFRYDRLGTVDENHYPIHGGRTKSVSFERLRVNHYLTKSLEEYRLRAARARPDPAMVERGFGLARKSAWDEDSERDEAIMRFLPALREALASPRRS